MDKPSSGTQRRRLRAELRAARLEAGLTQEQVAAAMDWSLSKVIRIEGGKVAVSTTDLRALLSHYQVTDPQKVSDLTSLARGARERSWWSGYADIASPRLLEYIEFENASRTVRCFQAMVVPGIIQTYEYARALFERFTSIVPEDKARALIDLRMRRQELLDNPGRPEHFFILDESVIRRPAGNRTVMLGQLARLVELAARPDITIEVVPFSAGVHPGLDGSFTVFELSDPADDVVYLETSRTENKGDEEEVTGYREFFEQLHSISLGPEGSVDFIKRMATEI